jgi:hypothetical protein
VRKSVPLVQNRAFILLLHDSTCCGNSCDIYICLFYLDTEILSIHSNKLSTIRHSSTEGETYYLYKYMCIYCFFSVSFYSPLEPGEEWKIGM